MGLGIIAVGCTNGRRGRCAAGEDPIRVAVIGAGRTRNGTGPFLAAFCAQAGAEVAAVHTNRAESAAAVLDRLRTHQTREAVAYTDPARMLESEALDALVIASPATTHAPWLEAALERGLPVLCEKPLVWGLPDPGGAARRLAEGFREAGLWLAVQAQWPQTLPTFRHLHPDAPACPARFEMGLAPPATGLDMLVESLSHPLSLLAHLAPDPEATLVGVRVRRVAQNWEVRFGYRARGARIEARIDVLHAPEQPRPAWYALDGYRVDRIVEMEPYRMWFDAGGHMVPLPDPTRMLVRSFLDDVASDRPPALDPAAVPGVSHLSRILAVAQKQT